MRWLGCELLEQLERRRGVRDGVVRGAVAVAVRGLPGARSSAAALAEHVVHERLAGERRRSCRRDPPTTPGTRAGTSRRRRPRPGPPIRGTAAGPRGRAVRGARRTAGRTRPTRARRWLGVRGWWSGVAHRVPGREPCVAELEPAPPGRAARARPSVQSTDRRGGNRSDRPPTGGRPMTSPVASWPVNQMKTRLQSLGLLDRALRATPDEELDTVVAALGDDHREAVERLAGGGDITAESIRTAAAKGRIDGTHGEPRPRAHRRRAGRLHRAARRPRRQPDERSAPRGAAGPHRAPRARRHAGSCWRRRSSARPPRRPSSATS